MGTPARITWRGCDREERRVYKDSLLSEYETHGSCSPKLFSKNKKRSYMRKQDTLARQRLVNAIIINATEGMELRV